MNIPRSWRINPVGAPRTYSGRTSPPVGRMLPDRGPIVDAESALNQKGATGLHRAHADGRTPFRHRPSDLNRVEVPPFDARFAPS
jgi:hypothetical protein